ncbi:MAG: hypothetical protein U9P38_04530 [Campylobacterota bacterium]|nr:hypothetical protein [Campylobacterota bacterium]
MKKITLYTLFTLLSLPLVADDNKTNWVYFGEFKTYFAKIHKSKLKTSNFDELLTYNSLQLNIDYLNKNFYLSVTPYAYIYITESGDELLGANYNKTFKDKDLFFRSLYMSYSFNKLTFGAGILPLSNSFPMHFTKDYYQDGEGLNIISDLDPLAIFAKYRFNDENKILIGTGVLDAKFIPTGHYINEHNIDKSYGIFITQTVIEGKFKIINDFKYTDIYFDKIETGEIFNAGVGFSWDDSEYSGWTFYNTTALSLYKNNSIAAKDAIIDSNTKITPLAISNFPHSFVFDNKTYKGAANLFGFRKDLDLFNIESFINFEWFHTFSDWVSTNKGAPYNSNCNQISNTRDNSYFINYGIRVNELSTLKINYTYIEFIETENIGAPSSTSVEESFGAQRDFADILKISFSYKF